MKNNKKTFGFTLVEMSIVLVVIGLLTGGIMAGKSLIRTAEIKSVTNDVGKYQDAVRIFSDKYASLPGDMPDAISVWGFVHATPATCETTVGTGTATCNGNGDGAILHGAGGTFYSETFRAWQQLANAGLIEGSYTGVTGSGGVVHGVPGTNIPAGKINGSGAAFYDHGGDPYSDVNWLSAYYQTMMIYGSKSTTGLPAGVIFKPSEMVSIDSKMDDGKPYTGRLMVFTSGMNAGCTTANTAAADYLLSNDAVTCTLILLRVSE